MNGTGAADAALAMRQRLAQQKRGWTGARGAVPPPPPAVRAAPVAPVQAPLPPPVPVQASAPVAAVDPAPALASVSAAPVEAQQASQLGNAGLYALVCLLFTLAGVAAVWSANPVYAPEMYQDAGMVPAADAFAEGKNYAVFDLNLNIRLLRDHHVARMTETPEVVIFGASHWQEAHAGLLPGYKFYNSHVHRDYWEDMLAVTEIWVRHGRLPKKIIIAMRDNLFTPMERRKDFLWEPGIPYYKAMAERLGIPAEEIITQPPYQRMRERLSLAMLYTNVRRWYNADERPHATADLHFKALDTLLPDGSILWSAEHMAIFTPERTRKESEDFAELRRNTPPVVEERGLRSFLKLLDFLKAEGVQVTFVQPPFNPQYYDRLEGSPYRQGLTRIEALTREIAEARGIAVIGSFDPHKVGCDATMYIDAEHSNPTCLQKIFDQFVAVDRAKGV